MVVGDIFYTKLRNTFNFILENQHRHWSMDELQNILYYVKSILGTSINKAIRKINLE